MKERDTLNKLIDDGAVARNLYKDSSAQHAIAALQTLLHWLGFDRELKWKKYGADGDYGKWVAGHNAVIKINNTVFLHGGLS